MQEKNVFLEASRKALRFNSTRGQLSVEDLWSLTLKDLDRIAVDVDSRRAATGKTFLSGSSGSAANKEDELRLDILKAIIEIRQEENSRKLDAAKKAQQKEFLASLLEKKQIEKLESLSEEEIQKQIDSLG